MQPARPAANPSDFCKVYLNTLTGAATIFSGFFYVCVNMGSAFLQGYISFPSRVIKE